jgi:hypothetical protein
MLEVSGPRLRRHMTLGPDSIATFSQHSVRSRETRVVANQHDNVERAWAGSLPKSAWLASRWAKHLDEAA